MADSELARAEVLRRQRLNALDAAYAGIQIPEPALEDIKRSAFFDRTTVERDATGRVDEAATLRNEGARAFVVTLLSRIDRAKHRKDDPQATAVSATAETSA